jgi:hypothetical protein
MTDLLTKYGFKSAGSCNCGGVFTQKYRCDTYLIRIRPRRYKFAIFDHGTRLLDWTDLKDLENKLNELFPRDMEAVQKA